MLGKDCWNFNYVQRVGTGGGYVKLFSSSNGPKSYITTPYLYLDTSDTADIVVTYTDGNYTLNVYYIDDEGNQSTVQDSYNFSPSITPGTYPISLDINVTEPGSYRVKYEFVYTNTKPSGNNLADKIGIDGVIVDGDCTSGIEFTVSGPEPPQFLPVGDHTLVYTATYTGPDGTIYTDTCSLTVHVIDTAPVIQCPDPITTNADPNLCAATVTIPTPTATDTNCYGTDLTANLTFTATRSDGLSISDTYPVGVTTITHTATDDNGNTDTCQQTVTVSGATNPLFDSTPAFISDVNCNDNLPVQEILTAHDCNGPVTVIPSIDAYTEDRCNGYEITYRWTAGTTVITRSFNVSPDTEAATGFAPIGISNLDFCANEIAINNYAPTSTDITNIENAYTDTCGNVTASFAGQSLLGNDCSWSLTRRYKISDGCPNNDFEIEIIYSGGDKTAPSLTGSIPAGATNQDLC
ncbi:HYR domain-containing protein, partial [Aestuariibaculum suncheonense]